MSLRAVWKKANWPNTTVGETGQSVQRLCRPPSGVCGGRWGSAGLGPGGEKLEGVAGAGASSRALCYKVSTLKTLGTGDTDQGAALAGLLPRGSHLHPGAGP